MAPDWPIGTRLDWIGSDWQIEKFVSQGKIGPRLAPDWHGLTWIGTDWHGLARIGSDWPGFADWRICVGTKSWPPIGTGLAWIDID